MKRLIVCFSVFLLFTPPVLCLDSIDFLNGYLFANLKYKQDFKTAPFFVSFNFDGKSLFPGLKERAKGDIIFSYEPFVNVIYQPDANVEFGVNFLVKYVFPLKGKIKPYIKGGVGFGYMTQHIREQGTQFNFLSQIGPGISYFINDNTSLDFECRFRHLSNADLDAPNKGVNANIFLWGITRYF